MKQNYSYLLGYPQKHSSRKLPSLSPLPEWLDSLLDQPWNPEANKQIDLWLWYCEEEGVQS